MNLDSLVSTGPEFLDPSEIYQLISTQINKEGSFFSLQGVFPRRYTPSALQPHQKVFTPEEVFEESFVVKAMRSSQHEVVQDKIQKNYLQSEKDQLELAMQLSCLQLDKGEGHGKEEGKKQEDDEENEEEILQQAIKLSMMPDNEWIKVRIRKPNGHFVTQNFDGSGMIKDVVEWINQFTGYEDFKLYRRNPEKLYLSDETLKLDTVIPDKDRNIIFMEDNLEFSC